MTSWFQQLHKVPAAEPGAVDQSLASTGSTRELFPDSTGHEIQLGRTYTNTIRRGKFWGGQTNTCLRLSYKSLIR